MDQKEVIARIKAGHEEDLEEIYRKYRKEFLTWITRSYHCSEEDGKDIFQATIVIFFESIVTGKLTALTSSIKTYLFAIGKNKIQELNRSQNKEVMIEMVNENEHFYLPKDGEDGDENLKKIEKCLQELGDPCKTILELYYYQKLSVTQITEKLNYKNTDTSKNLKYKCLQRLKKIYDLQLNNSR
jgi:RNA polymerase sigma factor (sigma-70 family)